MKIKIFNKKFSKLPEFSIRYISSSKFEDFEKHYNYLIDQLMDQQIKNRYLSNKVNKLYYIPISNLILKSCLNYTYIYHITINISSTDLSFASTIINKLKIPGNFISMIIYDNNIISLQLIYLSIDNILTIKQILINNINELNLIKKNEKLTLNKITKIGSEKEKIELFDKLFNNIISQEHITNLTLWKVYGTFLTEIINICNICISNLETELFTIDYQKEKESLLETYKKLDVDFTVQNPPYDTNRMLVNLIKKEQKLENQNDFYITLTKNIFKEFILYYQSLKENSKLEFKYNINHINIIIQNLEKNILLYGEIGETIHDLFLRKTIGQHYSIINATNTRIIIWELLYNIIYILFAYYLKNNYDIKTNKYSIDALTNVQEMKKIILITKTQLIDTVGLICLRMNLKYINKIIERKYLNKHSEYYELIKQNIISSQKINKLTKFGPKLVNPPNWEDIKECENNYSGGFWLNKFEHIMPLLSKKESNNHSVKLYSDYLLNSLNKIQNTPFIINWELVEYYFSTENPLYINKEIIQEKNNYYQELIKKTKKKNEKIQLQKEYNMNYLSLYYEQSTLYNALEDIKEQIQKVKAKMIKSIFPRYIKNINNFFMYNDETILKNIEKTFLDFSIYIYFPTGIDYRGRITPLSYFHFLGNKINRSILCNYYMYKVNKIAIINTIIERFKKEKFLMDQKLEIYSEIYIQLNQPKGFLEIVKKAKEPILIVPLLKLLQKEGLKDEFYTNILFFYDCTSSVLQLLALITENAYYKKELNFVKQNSTTIAGNIYLETGLNFIKYIKYKIDLTKSKIEKEQQEIMQIKPKYLSTVKKSYYYLVSEEYSLSIILDEYIKLPNREFILAKIFKIILMKKIYGATILTLLDEIKEFLANQQFCTKHWQRVSLINSIIYYLQNETSHLKFLNICNIIADLHKKLNLKICFNSEHDTRIELGYNKRQKKRIFRQIYMTSHGPIFKCSLTTLTGLPIIDHRKQLSSLSTAIIHMLDASLVHYINNHMIVSTLLPIHDSFGIIASDYDVLLKTIQNFYSNKFIDGKLHETLLKKILINILNNAESNMKKTPQNYQILQNTKNKLYMEINKIQTEKDYEKLSLDLVKNVTIIIPA